jgi:hypothetical protein
MARSSECTEQYAQKVLDGGDIVREAIYLQPSDSRAFAPAKLERDGLLTALWPRLIILGSVRHSRSVYRTEFAPQCRTRAWAVRG